MAAKLSQHSPQPTLSPACILRAFGLNFADRELQVRNTIGFLFFSKERQ
jgi:hypothetical protein